MIYLKLQGPWVVDNLKAISFISISYANAMNLFGYLSRDSKYTQYVSNDFSVIAFKHTPNFRWQCDSSPPL